MTSVRCPHGYDTLCQKCQEQGAEYGVMNPAVKPSREEKFIEKFVAYQDMGAFLCDDSYIVRGWEISAVIAEIKRLRAELIVKSTISKHFVPQLQKRYDDALEEVERLRAELTNTKVLLDNWKVGSDFLEKENERLRAACLEAETKMLISRMVPMEQAP